MRSLKSITLRDFTHVEVPFAKIKETEDLLKAKGVSLDVLPIEFVDANISNVPLQTLTYL